MKLLKIFRFELAYQARRPSTWLSFIAVGIVTFMFVRGNFLADALFDNFYINSPFVIAVTTVFACLFWLLIAAAVTGEVAARDSETGMHPLAYTAPLSKTEYLGGRFLAAFIVQLAILLAIPLGIMISVYMPGIDAEVIGPFRPVAYVTAFFYIVVPNAFIGVAIQFACATLSRRAFASYLGSVLLFVVVYGGIFIIFYFGGRKEVAALLDAFAQLTILDITLSWSPFQKNTQLIAMEGNVLWSRILWLGIAIAALIFTYLRFRFAHFTAKSLLSFLWQNRKVPYVAADTNINGSRISMPLVIQTFGVKTYLRQTSAIAFTSFRTIAKGLVGIPLLSIIVSLAVLIIPEQMENMGTPLLPRTAHVLTFLTTPLTNYFTPWIIIPLLIIFYAGELVWRERKAGLGEIIEASPVPESVYFLGRYLGLCLMLVVLMVFLVIAGILVQLRMDFHEFELNLYLKVLFGLQLPEYLLFALLALTIQGIIRQKYVGHMVALLIYALIIFASALGINHHLLVYTSGPYWKYDDIRGFGPSLTPWLWFKLFWTAIAFLLAVAATLFWVRGREGRLAIRMREARLRLTRSIKITGIATLVVAFSLGSFIYYNTNVLHQYTGNSDWQVLRAQYERRYAKFKHAPQPEVTATSLQVQLFPKLQQASISADLQLTNNTTKAIDSIHFATIRSVQTGSIAFSRKANLVISDDAHGHRSYALQQPLLPGDSLHVKVSIQVKPNGFSNSGINPAIVANGSYLRTDDWLPSIGYQASRELIKPGERRAQGLPARSVLPTLADAEANEDITGGGEQDMSRAGHISFDAIVSTDSDQIAIAPGALLGKWTKAGRNYFHYANEAPIGTDYTLFSARYTTHEETWIPPTSSGKPVNIQLYYHPAHAANVSRILRSVRASLANYSREYGPYPYTYLRLIENPARGMGAHAEPGMIDYGQGFALFNPADDPNGLDFPFAIIAHEMAHQWWGVQLSYAFAEGAGLLTESPAWYSAIGVVEETYGRTHMHRLMRFFRQPFPITPIRQSAPLLQGKDKYAFYRKGPFALHCLSEYMGKGPVNLAYRRLIEKQNAGLLGPATSLDLYRELQAVTPDSLKTLLHDLFAANTFWELKTKEAKAKQMPGGQWQVNLTVQSRKVVVDANGRETALPIDEWIELGVFAPTGQGHDFGKTLYLQKHRIHSGLQTITVAVSEKPADAGIDPYHLLIDLEPYDNVENVKTD